MRKNTYKHFLFFISLMSCHTTLFANEEAQSGDQQAAEIATNNHDILLEKSKKESVQIIEKYWGEFKRLLNGRKEKARQQGYFQAPLHYQKTQNPEEWRTYYYHSAQTDIHHYRIPKTTPSMQTREDNIGGCKHLVASDHEFLCFQHNYLPRSTEVIYDDLLALEEPALIIPLLTVNDNKTNIITRKYGDNLINVCNQYKTIPLSAFKKVTRAVEKMHNEGIFHFDIKIDNLVFKKQNEQNKHLEEVRLIDFDGRVRVNDPIFREAETNPHHPKRSPIITPEYIDGFCYAHVLFAPQDDLEILGRICDDYALLGSMLIAIHADRFITNYFFYKTLTSYQPEHYSPTFMQKDIVPSLDELRHKLHIETPKETYLKCTKFCFLVNQWMDKYVDQEKRAYLSQLLMTPYMLFCAIKDESSPMNYIPLAEIINFDN